MPRATRRRNAHEHVGAASTRDVMPTIPLIAHHSSDAVVAYRAAVPVTAGRFLADAARLATTMPAGDHVLNICSDRYRFTVGLAASLLAKKVSLLPSTHTPQIIRQLTQFAPDVFCMTDDPDCDIELPLYYYRDTCAGDALPWQVPQIDTEQLVAYVFTSGSTGVPVPHKKTWGRLVSCVREGARRLGLCDGRSYAILGTVPAQHMYGLESTVLTCLQSSNALCAERPFYPADICAGIAALPRPRVLVSTPIHLRTLLGTDVDLPALDLVVSATAALSPKLALDAERRFGARLLEIYGSTETGQIATRRTIETQEWLLWPEVDLTVNDGHALAQGGHIEQQTSMSDVLELTCEKRFILHGRTEDLVNIAGKRGSLGYLNHHLNAIPGVLDGTFLVREDERSAATGVARLAAFVVAPGLDAESLLDQLRERIDPVFLPRPLLFVERLPRNGTGKLAREALESLAASAPECTVQS
jgi:acyl-coenzyme A synthetase/AMP-(fatty) acid ligase